MTVVLILGAMFVLSWRITLAVLVLLPMFVLPARYWGRRIQAITRELMNAGSGMSSMMVERFNVAGAQLAKLFGRPDADSAAFETKARRALQSLDTGGAVWAALGHRNELLADGQSRRGPGLRLGRVCWRPAACARTWARWWR